MKQVIFGLSILVLLLISAACAKDTIPNSPPPTPLPVVPSQPPNPSTGQQISKEKAIEIASRGLPTSIVDRADIRAEVHGWYWEIIFDNLNAKADELMPYPLKPPPPGPAGRPPTDPYPGIWQSVIITVDAQTGDLKNIGARQAPKAGPYIGQEQAIQSARERVLGSPMDVSWIGRARVEGNLQGDTWIVLFWEENSEGNRIKALVDAVTGVTRVVGRE